jgi:ElaB/YqjD/DUF883 family membrane-anchored ribosome-binding protein
MAPTTEYTMEPNGASVRNAAKGATEQANKMVGSIGQSRDSAAQTIQSPLRRTRNSARAAIGMVTDSLDTSTAYLRNRGAVGVFRDVETLIRRHPFQILALGVSVGYLLSRSRQR